MICWSGSGRASKDGGNDEENDGGRFETETETETETDERREKTMTIFRAVGPATFLSLREVFKMHVAERKARNAMGAERESGDRVGDSR